MDKKLLNDQKKNIQKIIYKYNAYLIQECTNFKKFTGQDIDAFYVNKNAYNKNKFRNTIKRNIFKNHLRIYINDVNKIGFLSLDIEELSTMSKVFRNIFDKNFNEKYLCNYTIWIKKVLFFTSYINIFLGQFTLIINYKI